VHILKLIEISVMLFAYTSSKDIFVIGRGRELLADKNVTYYCHLDTSLTNNY
jgi:hypothetical protein